MAAPEERIRQYLDRHGGSVEVSVRQAVASWQMENPTLEDRARIERALAAVDVEADPPLDRGGLDSQVTLRVSRGRTGDAIRLSNTPPSPSTSPSASQPSSPAGAPPAGGTESRGRQARGKRVGAAVAGLRSSADRFLLAALAAGLVGSVLALLSDRLYGYGLALGVLAIALVVSRGGLGSGGAPGPRPLAWAAGALGLLAIVLGVVGSFTLDGQASAGTTEEAAAEREAFCASQDGRRLDSATQRGTGTPEGLREATDTVVEIAQDAPPGAECAVFALDLLADTWENFAEFPGYDGAGDQIERVRDLQDERGLREPAF